jgi:hypothetical protein
MHCIIGGVPIYNSWNFQKRKINMVVIWILNSGTGWHADAQINTSHLPLHISTRPTPKLTQGVGPRVHDTHTTLTYVVDNPTTTSIPRHTAGPKQERRGQETSPQLCTAKQHGPSPAGKASNSNPSHSIHPISCNILTSPQSMGSNQTSPKPH